MREKPKPQPLGSMPKSAPIANIPRWTSEAYSVGIFVDSHLRNALVLSEGRSGRKAKPAEKERGE